VKIDHLPLMLRVPSLPGDLTPGQRVHLTIENIDQFAPELTCRFLGLIGETTVAPQLDEVVVAEAGEVAGQ
ncbi:MAG: RNB domain-containing ribonuclease, partial [Azonexus sp.]|nr:RNB domain-containing ribonuclease [Azonexus sp.]